MSSKLEFYLSKNDVKFFTREEKEIEKIKRERNRLLQEKKLLIKDVQKREKILETLEVYLIQRIEKLKDCEFTKTAIYELEMLLNGLKEERNLIFTQEGRKWMGKYDWIFNGKVGWGCIHIDII